MSYKDQTKAEQAVVAAVPCDDCPAEAGEWCLIRRRAPRKQRKFAWLPTWLYDPPIVLGNETAELEPTERAPLYRHRPHTSRVFKAEKQQAVGMTHVSYEEDGAS